MSILKVNKIESELQSNNPILGSTNSETGLFEFPNPMPVTDSHHKGHVVQFHHYQIFTKNDEGVLIDAKSTSDVGSPVPVTFTPFREINVLPTNYLHLIISFVLTIKASSSTGRSFGTVYLNRVTGSSSKMEEFNPKNVLTKITYDAADTNANAYRTQPITMQYVDTSPTSYPMYGLYVANNLDYTVTDIQRSDPQAGTPTTSAWSDYTWGNFRVSETMLSAQNPIANQGIIQEGGTGASGTTIWTNPDGVTTSYDTSNSLWSVLQIAPLLFNGYDYQIESVGVPVVTTVDSVDWYNFRVKRRTYSSIETIEAFAEVKSSQGVTFVFQEIQQ
tara:strand:- start:8451 stop:9446 length:996 start_codon:yes stop_codon:yes gene_type:complete